MQGMKTASRKNRSVVRTSISLSPTVARKVARIAKAKRTSSNRILVGLIEQGLEAIDLERVRFELLAQKLIESKSEAERKVLKDELARMTFG